jgi:hypothetical protein
MMKSEFEAHIGIDLTPDDWIICEQAYNHPMFSNINGREELAAIFKAGGMKIMRSLAPAGEAYIILSNEMLNINQTYDVELKALNERTTLKRAELLSAYVNRFGKIMNSSIEI